MIRKGSKVSEFKNVVELAKLIREFGKKLIKEVPEYKYLKIYAESDRKRNSISIGISCDHDLAVENGLYKSAMDEIKKFVDEYRFVESEPMCDYYDCNFYYNIYCV